MTVRAAPVDLSTDDSYSWTSTPWLLERRTTAWQAPLAAASLITTAAHIPVTGEHLEEAPYIGVLFILLEIASVVLAVALIRRPVRVVLLAIAAVGALAVLTLVISRTIGLPLISDDVGNWTEPLAVVSFVAEMLMLIGGVIAAFGRVAASRRSLIVGLVAGIVILGAGAITVSAASAAATDEDAPHSHDMSGMSGMDMGLPAIMHSADGSI